MARVRVGVNGFGTIGKRVALALEKQPDMELVGVVKRKPDYIAMLAAKKGFPIYSPTVKEAEAFEKAGFRVAGTLEDLLSRVDVVVDATPNGQGAENKKIYEKFGVKMVFQGGEKPGVAEASFSTLCNYEETVGRQSLRVVSCNTTALLRLICTLDKAFGVERVRAVIVRRAADPREVKKGPINAILLNPPRLPSHHAVDVKTVLPGLDIVTAAVVVPTTLMHLHHVTLKLKTAVKAVDVLEALKIAPRIIVVSSEETGIKSTAEIIEAARQFRPMNDVPELVIFEESVAVEGGEVMLFQAVHQESIVVPENVDAVRAVTGLAATTEDTLKITDKTLGLRKTLW